MSHNRNSTITVIGIDIGKTSFHIVGLDDPGGARCVALPVSCPGDQCLSLRSNNSKFWEQVEKASE
jgi:hypothetical protein